jgi:hypothetical protein
MDQIGIRVGEANNPDTATGREGAQALDRRGVLTNDTHGSDSSICSSIDCDRGRRPLFDGPA